MLPPALSEGITSLNENQDRVAVVIEFAVDASGSVSDGKAYRALVRNRAQLAYNAVGAWLERVDAMAASLVEDGGYRRGGLEPGDLWDALGDPDADRPLTTASGGQER